MSDPLEFFRQPKRDYGGGLVEVREAKAKIRELEAKIADLTAQLAAWEKQGAVLADISRERARQDGKWGGQAHDDNHSTADFVQLIEDYAGWARTMAGMNSPDKARNRLVQVAALACAAVEVLDRKTLYAAPTSATPPQS